MSKKNQNYTNRNRNRFQPERMRGNVFVNNNGKRWLPGENGRAAKVERLLKGAKEDKKEIAGNMAGYKDSGVEWIGAIPEGWEIHPLRMYLDERKNKNNNGTERNLLSLSYGHIIRKDINTQKGLLPLSFNTYNIVEPSDIIIRPTDLQNDKKSLRVGYVTERGIITSAYFDLCSKNNAIFNTRFGYYLLSGYDAFKIFYGLGNGVRQSVTFKEFAALPAILPPLPEQQRIVDFLDTKCGILDRTIDAVSRQIEDLEKYKKALITKTVTKGICKKGESERAMKDSGVEWIGEVPEEWSVKRLKYVLASIRNGASAASYEYEPGSFRYVRITDIDDNGNLKQTGKQYLPKEMAKNFILNKKAVLIANTGSLGKAMLFDPDKENEVCALNGHLIEAIANPNIISNEYLYFFIKSYNYINWVNRSYVQTTMQMLSAGRHKNLPVTVPPLAEQQQIADYLDEKCKNIDNRVQKRKQQLEWLKEYKKSLIFDYVTGKKRV